MRKLSYGMNVTLDGYIAAHGPGRTSRSGDIGWSAPSEELFQWWLDRERANSLSLYGRRLWETMSSYWPTGDGQPDATPAEIEFARNWRDTPKVVFSSTIGKVGWNSRLVTGDAVAEITRLTAGDGGPMAIGGATLAGTAMRAGLIDEYLLVTHPVLVGGGTPLLRRTGQLGEPGPRGADGFPRQRAPDQVRDAAVSAALPSKMRDTLAAAPTQKCPVTCSCRADRV